MRGATSCRPSASTDPRLRCHRALSFSQARLSRQKIAAGLIQPYAGEFPDTETARVFFWGVLQLVHRRSEATPFFERLWAKRSDAVLRTAMPGHDESL